MPPKLRKPNNVWGKPRLPAARFHTYSDTHELELHDRTWRCRWCHQKGKDLRAECMGDRPVPKAAFRFRRPTKKGIKKAKGKKLWGRKTSSPAS